MQSEFIQLIDDRRDQWLGLLGNWCAISSGTFHLPGLARMADALATEFGAFGDVQRINLPPSTQIDAAGNEIALPLGQALRIVRRPSAALRVLLVIHYDTVYGPDNPFDCVTVMPDGHWNGPGVVDAKGGIAVMLAALHALEASPLAEKIGWEVILNPDEEIGSPGSAKLLDEAAKRNHFALLFEPALPDGSLVGERKGSGNFTVVVRGRAAHAGRDFAAGRSAIIALSRLIVKATAMSEGITLNCGQISGGGAVNIVPDLAIGRFNARISRADDAKTLENLFHRLIAEANQQDGIRASLHGSFSSPPKPLDEGSQGLLKLARDCGSDLGLNLRWQSSGGTCDGNRLAAAGLPLIDTMGPIGGSLHSPGEYLIPQSIAERAKLTAMLLLRVAQENLGLSLARRGI
jgi:glutamate carboxypeptidase